MTTPNTPSDDLQSRKAQAEVDKIVAEARSAAAKADKDTAEARAAQFAALIPDVSKIKESTLEVKEGAAMLGTVLTYRALAEAAATVCANLPLDEKSRVLVTTDADLASADASYHEVTSGLDQLEKAAGNLGSDIKKGTDRAPTLVPTMDLMRAVAGAMPAALSLVSTQQTVRVSTSTVTDQATTAAIAGALRARTQPVSVVHQDFRLIGQTGLYTRLSKLNEQRQQLLAQKAGRTDSIGTVQSGQIDAVVAAIDAFNAAVRAIPAGAKRSVLVTAALHEQLHAGAKFTHVLLIKAEPGQAYQVTQNRPLWFKDKFCTIVDVNLSYLLLDAAKNTVITAGTVTKVTDAYEGIGGNPTFIKDLSTPQRGQRIHTETRRGGWFRSRTHVDRSEPAPNQDHK